MEYEQLCGKHELYRLIEEGFSAMSKGIGRPASEVFDDIEEGLDE